MDKDKWLNLIYKSKINGTVLNRHDLFDLKILLLLEDTSN